jgi:hypothetical protein
MHRNPPSRPTRRLTEKQVVVLSAVERLGRPTIPELAGELTEMLPSEIVRVLSALEAKERVAASGCRYWIYLGDPTGIPGAPQIAAEDVVRFRAT